MKTSRAILLILFLSVSTVSVLTAQNTQAASDVFFQKYPVKLKFEGKPHAPKLVEPEARRFRTRIREIVDLGVNFADHYVVATWGCGAGCTSFAIVDAITGKVYIFPATVSQFQEAGDRITYRRDSKAIHLIGSLNEKDSADRWFVWDGRTLNIVSKEPAQLEDMQASALKRF